MDTLFADVSEFQAGVDDSYTDAGYRFISIRSNDGTYRDHKFAHNYQWCCAAADAGKITGFIVYFYWRTGSGDVDTHTAMVGTPHPKMATMIDLESGGNPNMDESFELNAEYSRLVDWHGGNDKKVIGYANLSDERTMWQFKPSHIEWILAGYGADPNDPSLIKLAHQYTDGAVPSAGMPLGAPPFGNCDMNSADGLSPENLAAALGIGTVTKGFLMALSDQQQQEVYDKIMAYPGDPNFGGKWPTRARYAPVPGALVDDTVGMMLWTDANGFDLMVEFAASQGYVPAKRLISARAATHPEDEQAVFYAKKYPV